MYRIGQAAAAVPTLRWYTEYRMERLERVSSHHSFIYLWVVGALLVLAGLVYGYVGSHPDGILDGAHEGDVRTTVTAFGNQLTTVSLGAADAAEQIRAAYAPFVVPELLAAWMQYPERAPGRKASSPWPSHIAIDRVTQNEEGAYDVFGRIILASSGGPSGEIAVVLTVAQGDGGYRITRYEEAPLTAPEPAAEDITLIQGESVTVRGLGIAPEQLVEDSRCPIGAACVQAGTVCVLVRLTEDLASATTTLTLNTAAVLNAHVVTLIDVEPYPAADAPIENAAYRYTFRIEER